MKSLPRVCKTHSKLPVICSPLFHLNLTLVIAQLQGRRVSFISGANARAQPRELASRACSALTTQPGRRATRRESGSGA